MPTHSSQTVANGIHIAIAYDVANAAARTALSVTAADVGKLCLQRDLPALFALVGTSPTNWQQVVDSTALGLKADTATVNTALGLKANTTDVNTALALKADATALAAKADAAFTIFTSTGSSAYTFVLADIGRFVRLSHTSAIAATIPPNSSVAFPVGRVLTWTQYGAGQVTAVAGSGVTLRATPTAKTRAQYSVVSATKIDTDEWAVSGDVAAT